MLKFSAGEGWVDSGTVPSFHYTAVSLSRNSWPGRLMHTNKSIDLGVVLYWWRTVNGDLETTLRLYLLQLRGQRTLITAGTGQLSTPRSICQRHETNLSSVA